MKMLDVIWENTPLENNKRSVKSRVSERIQK